MHSFLGFVGFYTGSVYNDPYLKGKAFGGEGRQDGSCITVKTHKCVSSKAFKKAILLTRNPYNTFLAKLTRTISSPVGHVDDKLFSTKSNRIFLSRELITTIV